MNPETTANIDGNRNQINDNKNLNMNDEFNHNQRDGWHQSNLQETTNQQNSNDHDHLAKINNNTQESLQAESGNKPDSSSKDENENGEFQPMKKDNNDDNKQPKTSDHSANNNDVHDDVESRENGHETSLSSATAFTISFDDDDYNLGFSKKLGIRDSIKKYAPPKIFNKPPTRAKSRDQESLHQMSHQSENSLMSIESAPGNLLLKTPNRNSRSSFDRHNRQRHSQSATSKQSIPNNISDSAAFLIDKMLNLNNLKQQTSNQDTKSHDFDAEVDLSEEKSDNGTYIVGSDRESQVARQKIDILFGVESKIGAEQTMDLHDIYDKSKSKGLHPPNDGSYSNGRSEERSGLSQERQNRIDRLARNPIRSSSTTRHENQGSATSSHQPRASSRQSNQNRSSRRSVSQSSKHSESSLKGHSQTRQSGRVSPLQLNNMTVPASDHQLPSDFNMTTPTCDNVNDVQISGPPEMKLNRAFALRRARLGLGEPIRQVEQLLQEQTACQSLIISPRRSHQTQQANNGYGQSRNQASAGGSSSGNFSRDDGGRFSLRMRNNQIPLRSPSGSTTNSNLVYRSSQHASYHHDQQSRGYNSSISAARSPAHNYQQTSSSGSAIYLNYQQNPDLDSSMDSNLLSHGSNHQRFNLSSNHHRNLLQNNNNKTASHHQTHFQKRSPSDLHESSDLGDNYYQQQHHHHHHYSTQNPDYEPSSLNHQNLSQLTTPSRSERAGSRFGALDNLVISAISGLSIKLRQSICDLLMENAKRLPVDNDTRSTVEEILPQLSADSVCNNGRSPTNLEDIDHSPHLELSKTLRNLKNMEQMVEVISLINDKLFSLGGSASPSGPSNQFCSSSNNTLTGSQHSSTSKSSAGSKKTAPSSPTNSTTT